MDAAQVQVETQAGRRYARRRQRKRSMSRSTSRPIGPATTSWSTQAGAPVRRRRADDAGERAGGRKRRWRRRERGPRRSRICVRADATGELRVGAAFVRDGAIEWATACRWGSTRRAGAARGAAGVWASGFSRRRSRRTSRFGGAAGGGGTMVVRISRGCAVGQRALRIGAGVARDRSGDDAEQRSCRASRGIRGSIRPAITRRYSASCGARSRRARSRSPRPKRKLSSWSVARASGGVGCRADARRKAAATRFRCSKYPTTAASAPVLRV